MAFREQQLLSTHSSCYDYIIIAAAMAHKHQNCAVSGKFEIRTLVSTGEMLVSRYLLGACDRLEAHTVER